MEGRGSILKKSYQDGDNNVGIFLGVEKGVSGDLGIRENPYHGSLCHPLGPNGNLSPKSTCHHDLTLADHGEQIGNLIKCSQSQGIPTSDEKRPRGIGRVFLY